MNKYIITIENSENGKLWFYAHNRENYIVSEKFEDAVFFDNYEDARLVIQSDPGFSESKAEDGYVFPPSYYHIAFEMNYEKNIGKGTTQIQLIELVPQEFEMATTCHINKIKK